MLTFWSQAFQNLMSTQIEICRAYLKLLVMQVSNNTCIGSGNVNFGLWEIKTLPEKFHHLVTLLKYKDIV